MERAYAGAGGRRARRGADWRAGAGGGDGCGRRGGVVRGRAGGGGLGKGAGHGAGSVTRSRNDGTARRLTNKDFPPINITKGLSSFPRACESGACRLRRRPSSERLSSPLAVRSSTSGATLVTACDHSRKPAAREPGRDGAAILATLGCGRRGQRLGVTRPARPRAPLPLAAGLAPGRRRGEPRRARDASGRRERKFAALVGSCASPQKACYRFCQGFYSPNGPMGSCELPTTCTIR